MLDRKFRVSATEPLNFVCDGCVSLSQLRNSCTRANFSALESLWAPIFAPHRKSAKDVAALELSFRQAAIHNPLIFHTQAAAGAGWALLTNQAQDENGMTLLRTNLLEQSSQALHHVNKAIRNPNFESSEEHWCALLFAIAGLACQSGLLHTSSEPFPLSPMASLQNWYILGLFEIAHAHVTPMYYFVEKRGGLSSFERYGLADVLEWYVDPL
jgi:hypothetical protein